MQAEVDGQLDIHARLEVKNSGCGPRRGTDTEYIFSYILNSEAYKFMSSSARDRFRAGHRNFSLRYRSRPALGPAQFPNQWIPEDLSLGVKRPGRKADQPGAEVKNARSYTPTRPYVFIVWYVVKYRIYVHCIVFI